MSSHVLVSEISRLISGAIGHRTNFINIISWFNLIIHILLSHIIKWTIPFRCPRGFLSVRAIALEMTWFRPKAVNLNESWFTCALIFQKVSVMLYLLNSPMAHNQNRALLITLYANIAQTGSRHAVRKHGGKFRALIALQSRGCSHPTILESRLRIVSKLVS